MGNADNQSYEVQVYHGKRWIVHARYDAHERGLAVREAKELDQDRRNIPVRVVMEDYNPKTGRHNEILIFRNKVETNTPVKPLQRRNWADMAVSRDGRVGYLLEGDDFHDPFEADYQIKPKVSFGMFLTIMAMIIIVGAASGVICAGVLALLMNAIEVTIAPTTKQTMLIAMLVIIWIIGSSSAYNHYKEKFDLNPFGREKKAPLAVKKSKISEQMEKAAEEIDKVPVQAVEPTPEQDQEIPQNIFEEGNVEIQYDEDEIELSDEAQQQKMFLINFLGTCLSALKGPDVNENALNKFGLNLFMTGAVVRMASEKGLNEEEENEILCRILEMLGTKPDQALRFAEEYEKYLNTPRHQTLFEYAGDIAVKYSDGDQSAPLYIRETIEDWINWKPTVEEHVNPNLLTIMFTDMVGSTDLTTKHGDYAAQEVLKAHDLIVRTALTNLEGKEIKHLGDGIMASFKDYDKAVQAAIEIQKRVEGNNRSGPEFPLHVRIGLNAGEPIKKDNDLFGTSVQLAARLCDKTPSDCISVSKDLVDLFGEQPVYTFLDMGPQELKGFNEPQPIYQLDWTAPPLEYPDMVAEESGEEEGQPRDPEAPIAPDLDIIPPEEVIEEDPNFDAGLPVAEIATPANPENSDESGPKTV